MRTPPRTRLPGPGILLAATAIGGSHLVLSTTAGAQFGYSLLWLIVLAHLLKYHAFEAGPRIAVARDMSLLSAYREVPGPRNWAIWVGLFDMLLQSVGVLAAVAALTASILQAAFGGPGLAVWTAMVIAITFLMLLVGRYPLLRNLNLGMIVGLAIGTMIAFFAAPPPLSALKHAVIPELPAGSLLLVASILGFLPTAIGVSIWQSLWTLEDPHCNGRAIDEQRTRAQRLRDVLRDLRLGYLLSAALAICFLCLGAAVLYPRGLIPGQFEVATTLARIYTELFGTWMRPLFYMVAFFTAFSTSYAIMDGMPRTLVAAIRHLRDDADPERPDRGRLYWSYLLALTLASIAVVRAVPDPVLLLTVLGALSFLFSPLYYGLNTWAVTRLIEDPALGPGRGALWLSRLGIAFLAAVALLLLYTEIGIRWMERAT